MVAVERRAEALCAEPGRRAPWPPPCGAEASPAQTLSPAGALMATGQSWFPSTPFTPTDLNAWCPDPQQRHTWDLARNA